jgi:hypothetical protein
MFKKLDVYLNDMIFQMANQMLFNRVVEQIKNNGLCFYCNVKKIPRQSKNTQ